MSHIIAIAADAADALALQRPLTLFGVYNEGDTSDRKLLRAITQACRFLAASYDWSVLKARRAWTSTATEAQAALPADFLRLIMGTAWDESLRRPLSGPLSDEEWAGAKSSIVGRVEPAFVIHGGEWLMVPAPPAGRSYAFGYIRDAIGKDGTGARLSRFTADNDAPLWDDELVTLGAIYEYRKAERFDYAQDELDFKLMMQDRIKRDGGGRVIRMGDGAQSASDMAARMKSGALFIDPTA